MLSMRNLSKIERILNKYRFTQNEYKNKKILN